MKSRLVFGLSLFAWLFTATANGQDLPCSSSPATASPDQKITPDLCSELRAKADLDFLPIVIYFKRDSAITDTVDPKKDTGKGISSPSDTATPAQYVEYTRQLFINYDLRDLADSSRRLSIPEKVAGNYLVLATKKTILEINQAPYIMNISHWDTRPAGVKRLGLIKKTHAGNGMFDLTGRRITSAANKANLLMRWFQ